MQCPFRTSSLAPIIWLSEGLTDPVQCVYHSIGLRKFTIRKGMELSGSEDDFMVLTSREKKNKKHFSFHPILKTRQGQRRVSPAERGAVEVSRSLPGVFQDVGVQFNTLRATLSPHIKNKSANSPIPVDTVGNMEAHKHAHHSHRANMVDTTCGCIDF